MAEQIFTQKISEDAAGRKHVSIGQTRDGKDEWITPVTMWEKNKLSGLYLPPGFLPDDDVAMPRVKVQLPGSENFAKDLTIQEVTSELELVKAELQAIKANQLSGDQKVTLSGTMTEHYGADVNSRPPADTVLAGATFTIVDDSGYFQTWISDGTKWVEV